MLLGGRIVVFRGGGWGGGGTQRLEGPRGLLGGSHALFLDLGASYMDQFCENSSSSILLICALVSIYVIF